ncbi:MAG: MerR family transcriptional regulator [Ilumatobacteraceae bacterium]
MKIAGLSGATGVSVATLKYYLRESLLHPGAATAVNQADYDDSHVRRVRLIRALVELGGLSLADVGTVLAAVDDDTLPVHDAFGVAQDAMVPHRRPAADSSTEADAELHDRAMAEVDRFVRRHGLDVRPDAAVRTMLADALAALSRFGWAEPGQLAGAEVFDGLVAPAMAEAEFSIDLVPEPADRGEQLEYTVVGTVVFEVANAAVRRMALEHHSHRRFARTRRR